MRRPGLLAGVLLAALTVLRAAAGGAAVHPSLELGEAEEEPSPSEPEPDPLEPETPIPDPLEPETPIPEPPLVPEGPLEEEEPPPTEPA